VDACFFIPLLFDAVNYFGHFFISTTALICVCCVFEVTIILTTVQIEKVSGA
jgi:hypothetical protein